MFNFLFAFFNRIKIFKHQFRDNDFIITEWIDFFTRVNNIRIFKCSDYMQNKIYLALPRLLAPQAARSRLAPPPCLGRAAHRGTDRTRPNAASKSIGNLILHLNGNVTQWLIASFNRRQDLRDRPAEFAAESGLTATELLDRLGATMSEAAQVLSRLTEADLLAPYEIQGYHVTGLEAVYQVVEHFGLHYGQIAYISKSLTGRDLGFYRELTKTGRAD